MSAPQQPENGSEDPFESAAARPVQSDEELNAGITTPAGEASVGTKTTPGSPLNLAQALLLAAGGACGWMVAAGWTFGYALDVNPYFGAAVALVPALALLGVGLFGKPERKKRGSSDDRLM